MMQRCVVWLFAIATGVVFSAAARADSATGRQGMVATVHPLATDAGLAALRRGGNAVDAAVAAALTLGVVDGHNSGIGGGCFVLIRRADGVLAAIDGRETAPALAHRDLFIQNGQVQREWSETGALASGTPGALAAYDLAIRQHGCLSLAELLEPAARIAECGFALDRVYARDAKSARESLAGFQASRAVFLKADGSAYALGEILKQADLADTYRSIAQKGIAWFYNGPFAAQVEQWMQTHGGIVTKEDFAKYRAVSRRPIVTTYRDFSIVGFPPPSSGGVHVAQILNILEHFDLRAIYREDQARFHHLLTEAMKLAFADRAHWLGDADFVEVPRGLADKTYAAQLAARIDLSRATPVAGHGQPPGADRDFFNKHTTHIAAADAEGCWVAVTSTINTNFGSKVVIPGTGVVMNNQMDDFSIQPGVPNVFGLVGAEANAIQAGKRPLSSMSPTIVLQDDQPIMTLGAAGGPTIITQVVQAIVRHIDLRQSLQESVASPRVHHQWSPDVLFLEKSCPSSLVEQLQKFGHTLEMRSEIGVTQGITQLTRDQFLGVFDPRVPGKAAGW
jgi:gamma-glutamyltranspeptidase/glutathione hydrolase